VLLQVDNITKSFGGVKAVKSLSFSVNQGDIIGLIGPNGAGKTTAFNLIAGIYKPDFGLITFDGRKISGLPSHKIVRAGISRTFQNVKPFGRMTVLENVAVGGLFGREHVLSVTEARREAMEILRYTSLEAKAGLPASLLSLAEQRRLELARAIATKPKLLMLDELMAGLNHSEIIMTLDLIGRLRSEKGITLLVIEHVMKAIIQLCNRLLVLDYGEKISEGAPLEVMKDKAVIAAYMGEKKNQRSQETMEEASSADQ
jgi:branched-chain amino acid transport system ATP-binding protein